LKLFLFFKYENAYKFQNLIFIFYLENNLFYIKLSFVSNTEKLIKIWAKCIKENTLMRRTVFQNPINKENSYVRVRDEWDKITCTYKEILPWKLDINSIKEIETEVENYESMVNIFKKLWLKQKAIQETYREIWSLENEVFFMIDVWPWLKPFLEIEWESEEIVKLYSKKLWFDYNKWLFWAVDEVYYENYEFRIIT